MEEKELTLLRQKAIKQLIKKNEIEDQETLVDLIKKKYGIETSQAAVSRDLRALGASKQKLGDKMAYAIQDANPSKEILRLAVVSVSSNEAMIIVHTLPGLAAFVADYIDMKEDFDILATLSGENVVFIAPCSVKNIHSLSRRIADALYIKNELKKNTKE